MISLSHFNSLKEYGKFAFARGFRSDSREFCYQKGDLEKIGDLLVAPLFYPLDKALRNIRNPLMITALTVAAIALLTIAFYPLQSYAIAVAILPPLVHFTVSHLKIAAFIASQALILGLGFRTFSRLNNEELMGSWDRKLIQTIPIGAVLV